MSWAGWYLAVMVSLSVLGFVFAHGPRYVPCHVLFILMVVVVIAAWT